MAGEFPEVSMDISASPRPQNIEPSPVYLPTLDELYSLADTASRSGDRVVVDSFNKLIDGWQANTSSVEHYTAQGVNLDSFRLNTISREASVMNYESLRRDPPFDADNNGLGGVLQMVLPEQKKGDDAGPAEPPVWSSVPGATKAPPDIFPLYLIGKDGHGGAPIAPDFKAALGSQPADYDIDQTFEEILQADAEAAPADDDLAFGVQSMLADVLAAKQQDLVAQRAPQAASPDGIWAERFGLAVQKVGQFVANPLSGVPDHASDPNVGSVTEAYGANPVAASLLRWGKSLRRSGRQLGTNVSLSEQMGAQTPGPRGGAGLGAGPGVTVTPLNAIEYRAHLHDLRNRGQLGFSAGYINSIPEAELMKQLERFQQLAGSFRRQAVLESGQAWADLAVTLPTMAMGSNVLAARLAVPRLVASRMGTIGVKSLQVAARSLGEATIGGVHGYAMSDGPNRLQGALTWAAGGAAVPVAGFAARGTLNMAAGGGRYFQFANQSFKRKLGERLTREGMNPELANAVAEGFDDWHRNNWTVMGNGNLEWAATRPHLIDQAAFDAVKKTMPGASDDVVRKAAETLQRQGDIVKNAVKDRKRFVDAVNSDIKVTSAADDNLIFAGGFPDPKRLQAIVDKVIKSGKTIDRKQYKALQQYLDKAAEALPHVADQYKLIQDFLASNYAKTDELSAYLLRLSQDGSLAKGGVPRGLSGSLSTFRASVKAAREHMADLQRRAFSDAADILTDANRQLMDYGYEVQAWVKRGDPLDDAVKIERQMNDELEAVVPFHLEGTVLQHEATQVKVKKHSSLVSRLRDRLRTTEGRRVAAIAKQQKKLIDEIKVAKAHVEEVRATGIDARVDQAVEAAKEHLASERDVAIRALRDEMDRAVNKLEGSRKRAKNPSAVLDINAGLDRKRGGFADDARKTRDDFDQQIAAVDTPEYRADIAREMTDLSASEPFFQKRLGELEAKLAEAKEQFVAHPKSKRLPQKIADIEKAIEAHGKAKRLTPHQQDIAAAQHTVDALQEKLAGVAGRTSQHFNAAEVKMRKELTDVEMLYENVVRDLHSSRVQLEAAGILDAVKRARKLAAIRKKYTPKITRAMDRANEEAAGNLDVFPKKFTKAKLTPEEGQALREMWRDAQEAAATVRGDAVAATRAGESAILDAQTDILQQLGRHSDENLQIIDKFNASMRVAGKNLETRGLAVVDGILDQVAKAGGGRNVFGKVADDASHVPLLIARETMDETELKDLMKGVARLRSGLGYAMSAITQDGVMLGKVRPKTFFRMAERVADVPVGRYKSINDVPVDVLKQMVDMYDKNVAAGIKEFRGRSIDNAITDAVKAVNDARAAGAGDLLDQAGIPVITPEKLAEIEAQNLIKPGTFTRIPLSRIPPRVRKGLEKAFGLDDGTLTKASADLTTSGLEAIEKKNGLAPGSLTTMAGRMKLINKVLQKQASDLNVFRTATPSVKQQMMKDNPDIARYLADTFSNQISEGVIQYRASQLGLDASDPYVRTKIVAEALFSIIEDERNGLRFNAERGLLSGISKTVNQWLGDSYSAHVFLNSFSLFSEVLGKRGFDIEPLLDELRRSVLKEQKLHDATTSQLSAFMIKMQELYGSMGVGSGKAFAEQRRVIGELVTDYRLARDGAKDARKSLAEVEQAMMDLGADPAISVRVREAADANDALMDAYHDFLRTEGYDVGEIPTYAPHIDKKIPTEGPPQNMKNKISKTVFDWFTKERKGKGTSVLREFDATKLVSQYHDSVSRDYIMGNATRMASGIEDALRTLTASADNPHPKILDTFTETVSYIKGQRKYTLPKNSVIRWLARQGSRRHALMLTDQMTTVRQIPDPMLIMGTLASRERFVGYELDILGRLAKPMNYNDPDVARVTAYLHADGISGKEYRIYDDIGFQHGELMEAAKTGEIVKRDRSVDQAISFLLRPLRHVDERGRIISAQAGEKFAMDALGRVPKNLPAHEAFDRFRSEFSGRVLSEGQWNDMFTPFQEAYTKGNVNVLREAMGKKVSLTLMFDYFPGGGSLITRNPFLRLMLPFSSYPGSRNALIARTVSRNEGIPSVTVPAALEAVGIYGKYFASPGALKSLSFVGGLSTYTDYLYDPMRPVYDQDATNLRAGAELLLGPGVGGIVNITAQFARTLAIYGKMSITDVNKMEEVILAGGVAVETSRGNKEILEQKAKEVAGQLGTDAYDVLVRSVGIVNMTRSIVEGVTDNRDNFSTYWAKSQDAGTYNDELSFWQMVIYYGAQRGGKPLAPVLKEIRSAAMAPTTELDGSFGANARLINEAFWKGAGKKAVVGRGVFSRAILEASDGRQGGLR